VTRIVAFFAAAEDTLATRYLRAQVLQSLGRFADALAEIDAFASIQAEVLGARHPDTLATESFRIGIAVAAGDRTNKEARLPDIIAGLEAALGPKAYRVSRARYRLARSRANDGRLSDAAPELRSVVDHFDEETEPDEPLLRSVRALLTFAEGGPSPTELIT
jgi:hypothetical protein